MRVIETQAVAMKTTSRAFRPLAPAVAVLLALMLGACGGSATGPSAIGGFGDEASLSGTWRGGNGNESLVWQLTQEGDTVTGSGFIAHGGRWRGDRGEVAGTLSGNRFRFHESHAVGTTSVPGCSVEVDGVLEVTSYRMVVDRSGPPSPTPGRYENYVPPSPQTITRMQMSGSVSGRGCGGDLNSVVTLVKD